MLQALLEPSAFAVFLAIAAAGFLLLLISLIFGELFEHFDVAVDHDLDHGGPGFFSTRVLSVFITAFGGFGAIGTHYGLGTLAASGLGFVSGFFFGSLIYFFARFLYSQQSSSDVRMRDLEGLSARVIVAIPANGVGQVRCSVGEELVDKVARSGDGRAIADGTSVKIDEVLGETVIVSVVNKGSAQ